MRWGEASRVISPEDIVLVKLVWYRSRGDSSERQWNDLATLVAVQGRRLARGYLEVKAERLGVADLVYQLLS